MSTHQAPAPNMTETSVIKHYKKQLIYRQHDVPEAIEKHSPPFLNEVGNTKIYEEDKKNEIKKIRRKRKNKNCRGQFRHEDMELIKLGTNPSHTLCKTKDPVNTRMERPVEPTPTKDDRSVPQTKSDRVKEPTNPGVIHTNYVKQTILEEALPKTSQFGHTLPQMVPERRNSRELPIIYRSPAPPRPSVPEYRVPMHPPYPLPHPGYSHPPPLGFRPTPTLPPPPPYPVARSPPRPVPRSPIRPQPAYPKNVPYSGIHFPFTRQPEYHNGYHVCKTMDYIERKKRKHEEKPVVAAIDLTVDSDKGQSKHKCKCECGKIYPSVVPQEVIITVKDRDSSQVPSTYIRGKMMNGVLQFDPNNSKNKTNGAHNGVVKSIPPASTKGQIPLEPKPPHMFRIDDLLSKTKKDTHQEKKTVKQPLEAKKIPLVPIRTEPNRVIFSTRKVEERIPRPKSKDYSVSTIIGDNRRQSVDIDTISISSSSSESVRSPRPKSNGIEKHIPHGKLFHYKNNNSFIRYFDDTQKKLFMDSITSNGNLYEKKGGEEVIRLPPNAIFSGKDSLTVEEYVSEMTLVERFIPKDFFLFYKFVTGYQICNNNLPVSFLTFLKVYNTNGLKVLLERYISSLKQS